MKKLITLIWYLASLLAYRIYGISGVCSVLRHIGYSWTIEKILRRFGADIGQNVTFCGYLKISNAEKDFSNLTIDRKVSIGQDVFIDLSDIVIIEEEAVVAMHVSILTHQEAGKNRAMDKLLPRKRAMVRIRFGSFIGEGSSIQCGSDIGTCACVGCKSMVRKTVPSYEVWAGSPARLIRKLEKPYETEGK